jgi:hypothetical protein
MASRQPSFQEEMLGALSLCAPMKFVSYGD